ncbi:MAG TPA: polyphenol oxidase family protein [Sedimentisphaerales bacterium]|jgi:YfiH family protein|nr:polyphenol oxidase family protein [Sedimentisphaerales bacterium]HNU30267.1 polyphenol oxidase family protein [Sedimentisphaerales bacterium]
MTGSWRDRDGGFRTERLANGWLVGRFAALERIGVPHLVTTREGPDVQRVRHDPATTGQEIAAILDLEDAAFLEQVHGGEVLTCEQGGCAGFADGLVTTTRGLVVLGKSGDCPIVLIADRRGHAVGFAHASWKATVVGITPAVVGRMVDLGCASSDLVACICPSAGPCCYEVGDEVRVAAVGGIGHHAESFFQRGGRQLHFDLWQANADALVRCGLPSDSIHVAGICTLCRNDLFPSHRREGNTAGRFAAVVGLPAVGMGPSD